MFSAAVSCYAQTSGRTVPVVREAVLRRTRRSRSRRSPRRTGTKTTTLTFDHHAARTFISPEPTTTSSSSSSSRRRVSGRTVAASPFDRRQPPSRRDRPPTLCRTPASRRRLVRSRQSALLQRRRTRRDKSLPSLTGKHSMSSIFRRRSINVIPGTPPQPPPHLPGNKPAKLVQHLWSFRNKLSMILASYVSYIK